jgi:hypothetical protein
MLRAWIRLGEIMKARIIMNRELASGAGILSEEIKALLILLLLKGGTPSDEIETALRLAGSRPVAPPALPQASPPALGQEAMCPLARAAVLAMAPSVAIAQQPMRQAPPQPALSAKAILRNEKLAPLQCYAA